MQYRDLGKTGLRVSRVGYGGENIADADMRTTQDIINMALDAGINIMDVFMPQPQVRSQMGDALGSRRKDVLLQGHIGSAMQDGQYVRTRDVALCDEYIRDFLNRFHTDYIDLGMLHFIDTEDDYKQSFESGYIDYVQRLKKDGVIRHIGVSTHNAVTAMKMIETGLIEMMMFSINPAFDMLPSQTDIGDYFSDETYNHRFEIDPDRAALYRMCEERGVGITVMKTLGSGRLLSAQASSFGMALTPVKCMHYALERPAVSSVLMGARSTQELAQSLEYETATDEQKDYTCIAKGTQSAMKGKCMYCNHCLPCPVGIDIAAVNKYLDLAIQQGGAPAGTVREHYLALSAHASDCIQCGACERRCPFAVDVRKNMKRAQEIFGQ